jgi:hypothetical protein
VLDAYIEGLTDAGARFDPDDVMLAYTAASALRWGFAPYRLVASAIGDEAVAAFAETLTGRPFDEAVDYFAEGQAWLLDLADDAYRLASKRS